MVEIVLLIIFAVVMLGIFILLYYQGNMVFKSIRAVTFIGSTKRNSARFSSCSGYIKRVIKFKEDGIYTFTLDAELSKGDMSIELTDSSNKKIMQLDCSNRSASITAEKKKKYYLTVNFSAATGWYALTRE
ncbi:MAG: hypothetical protein J6L96_00070 [Clostridia bacterium]|nr:hypothetical protein [Clostridia bacterium]